MLSDKYSFVEIIIRADNTPIIFIRSVKDMKCINHVNEAQYHHHHHHNIISLFYLKRFPIFLWVFISASMYNVRADSGFFQALLSNAISVLIR
jgi:hypothetical protein